MELARASRDAGLYSTLVTAGTPFTRSRAEALREAGLDHVQISIQDSDPISSDRIAGTRSFSKKIEAAHLARELGFPLTINVVLHRHNLDRIESIIALAEELDARRIELANTQYQGWAAVNREALMPTWEQLEHGEAVVNAARERIGPKMEILWVLPDYFEEYPKPCMGGWGRDAMVIAPNGDVLPCQAASTIPDLEFANVRDKPLAEIWFESEAFQRFPRHRTGCRSPVAAARSTARRRTSVAVAARRSHWSVTPPRRIRCARSRRTTRSSSRRASQRCGWQQHEDVEFVYRTEKVPTAAS